MVLPSKNSFSFHLEYIIYNTFLDRLCGLSDSPSVVDQHTIVMVEIVFCFNIDGTVTVLHFSDSMSLLVVNKLFRKNIILNCFESRMKICVPNL